MVKVASCTKKFKFVDESDFIFKKFTRFDLVTSNSGGRRGYSTSQEGLKDTILFSKKKYSTLKEYYHN